MSVTSRSFGSVRSRLGRHLIAVVAAASVLALSAMPAQAAFPGKNGKIAYACLTICTINPDGTGRRFLELTVGGYDAAWSPGGDKVAFTGGSPKGGEIWVIGSDGTQLTRLTTDEADDRAPAWSPDGKKIVFASNRGQTSPCNEFYNYGCAWTSM